MSLNQRRLLYIAFILLFIIITPLFWLYAAGYKLGSGFKFEKTGILIIDSEPERAEIFLDGELLTQEIAGLIPRPGKAITTPAKVKNLLPGEYLVRLESNGYWPWEKKLEIWPGESTFAEDIVLFKNELPLSLVKGESNSIIPAPGTDLALLENNGRILVVNIKKSQVISEYSRSDADSRWQWLPGNKKISDGGQVFAINSLDPIHVLPPIFKTAKKPPAWTGDDQVFAASGRDIISYSLLDEELRTFPQLDEPVELAAGYSGLYALKRNGTQSIVSVIDRHSGENKKDISLPLSDYAFLNRSLALLDVYDLKHDILYLIDPLSDYQPLYDIINGAKKTDWISEKQLVYTDGHEIWLSDLDSRQKILIARYSEKINNLLWHPSKNYIIFSTDGYIATLELDKRDKYNITYLIKDQKIKDIALCHDGSRLLFTGSIAGQAGGYELILQ